MADKVKKFTDGNVAWDADYDNIILVDPNKIFDKDGKVQERLVDHENLVMYANLEARIIPRTKLAVGENFNDVSIANFGGSSEGKLNFLSPEGKRYLDSSWSDQITGQGSLEGRGINQTQESIKVNKEEKKVRYIRSVNNVQDTQLLGITNIKITNNASFIPLVSIELVDVQGRALFELGEKSPYSAFMQLPYPLFFLTVKGYYGKAIRYELMLKSFNARFDPQDGNYRVSLEFIGRTAAILSDLPLGSLMALPHMYNSTLNIPNSTNGLATGDAEKLLADSGNNVSNPASVTQEQTAGINQTQSVASIVTTRGMKKIREVYDYYESKGLIPPNFPRLTISQMKMKLEKLEEYITNSFVKEDLGVLNDIDDYRKTLADYRDIVYSQNTLSWFQKYMDGKNVLVDKNNGSIYYTFKPELELQKKKDAIVELQQTIIRKNNDKLASNTTFGENGQYTINGKTKSSSLTFTMNYNDFPFLISSENLLEKIDLERSYILTNNATPNDVQLSAYTLSILTEIKAKGFKYDFQTQEIVTDEETLYFKFGTNYQSAKFTQNTFLDKIDTLQRSFDAKEETIEKELSEALLEKIESSENGLGFKPSIRNILAVIMASADGFYRLMDDVHTEAWKLKSDPVRLQVIMSPEQSTGVDNKFTVNVSDNTNGGVADANFVYPWPQYFEEETDQNGNKTLVVKYIGLPGTSTKTKAYLYDKWPEVEFLEEYVTGQLLKNELPEPTTMSNQRDVAKFIPSNAIEFPYASNPYGNLSEVPFFYEIWERTYLASNYSKLFREQQSRDNLYSVLGDFESYTIKESISSDPQLMMILKRYGLNFQTFEPFLKNISNNGTGTNWNRFIRDEFNTDYIRANVENDSYVYSIDTINTDSLAIEEVQESQQKLKDYLKNTQSNELDYTDVYPFTNLSWLQNNMANGQKIGNVRDANDTTKSLYYFDTKKTISSFDPYDLSSINKDVPLTSVAWVNNLSQAPNQTKNFTTNLLLKQYYGERFTNNLNLFITESKIKYGPDYQGKVGKDQTTSLLNTPYFINSIIEGTNNVKSGNQHPYKNLAYIFLNSLPLSTLKEKSLFTNSDNGVIEQSLKSYLGAIFNKTSAIHKLPYAWILKFGSIWHRYKNYVENNVDHLDSVWTDFNYQQAYDPVNGMPITDYNITKLDGANYLYQMNSTLANSASNVAINIGLYPELINSIHYMFFNKDMFNGYTQTDWTQAYNNGLRIGVTTDSKILVPDSTFATSTNQNLTINNWYQYIVDTTGLYDNSLNESRAIIIPSTGGLKVSQYKYENTNPTDNTFIKSVPQIVNDKTLYNGSARALWGSSNFGFFDNSLIKKPTYKEYLKVIENNKEYQDPFTVTYEDEYSNIEELLSVFPKELLDSFENLFLDFCNLPDDPIQLLLGESTALDYFDFTDLTDVNNRNIVSILRSLFIVESPKQLLENPIAYELADSQINNFTAGMVEFLGYQVILKRGNPGNFDRRVFNSLSTDSTFIPTDAINFGNYITNSLPTAGGTTTLVQSQAAYPAAWKALRLYVGEFSNTNLSYKNTGSYITDFFVDLDIEFNETNVIRLSQLIKIYSSQKLENPSISKTDFINGLNQYLKNLNKYQSNILNHLFTYLNKNIPNITEIKENKRSSMDGDIAKTELWDTFKVLNDKWIAGGDFKNRVLFEDFLFMDRANRDIGDKIIVDVNHLTGWLSGTNEKASLYSLIGEILAHNNFIFMALPAYVNFYGVQEVTKNAVPQNIDIPNSAFGTFLEVDYQKNKPKFVCMYTDKLSEHTNQSENIDYRFGNDSFDLRRSSENPLVENQNNKQDWGSSNKVVGFNVDFGIRNQNIFKSISLDQSQFKNTSETFQVLVDMANQTKGQKAIQQSTSLFNIYKSRNYTCEVQSMGNVMIQPTMYFNLRYVPMFTGPYWILNVSHVITPNDFQTSFSGVRISKFSFPQLDKLTMSVNLDLLRRYKKQTQQITSTNKNNDTTPTGQTSTEATTTVTNGETGNNKPQGGVTQPRKAVQSDCLNKTKYPDLSWVDTANKTLIGKKDVINYLKTRTDVPLQIRRLVFAMAWVEQGSGAQFSCVQNDLYGIHTDGRWAPEMMKFVTGQACVSVQEGGKRPLATFDSYQDSIKFVFSRFNSQGFVNVIDYFKSQYNSESEACARVWKGYWNLGVGFRRNGDGPNSPYNRINEAIAQANDRNPQYWNNTVKKFQSALEYATSNGL